MCETHVYSGLLVLFLLPSSCPQSRPLWFCMHGPDMNTSSTSSTDLLSKHKKTDVYTGGQYHVLGCGCKWKHSVQVFVFQSNNVGFRQSTCCQDPVFRFSFVMDKRKNRTDLVSWTCHAISKKRILQGFSGDQHSCGLNVICLPLLRCFYPVSLKAGRIFAHEHWYSGNSWPCEFYATSTRPCLSSFFLKTTTTKLWSWDMNAKQW